MATMAAWRFKPLRRATFGGAADNRGMQSDSKPEVNPIWPEPSAELDACASVVLTAALEVHRALGPGFIESVYERALCVELSQRGIPFHEQVPISVVYKGVAVGQGQMDLVVANRLVVELKAVEALAPIHKVQLRSYLKATGLTLGLLINFNVPLLRHGIRRVILSPSSPVAESPA